MPNKDNNKNRNGKGKQVQSTEKRGKVTITTYTDGTKEVTHPGGVISAGNINGPIKG